MSKEYFIINAPGSPYLLVDATTWDNIQKWQRGEQTSGHYQWSGRIPGIKSTKVDLAGLEAFLPQEDNYLYTRVAMKVGDPTWTDTGMELHEPTRTAEAAVMAVGAPERVEAPVIVHEYDDGKLVVNLTVEYFAQANGLALQYFWRLGPPLKTLFQVFNITQMARFLVSDAKPLLEIFETHIRDRFGPEFQQADCKLGAITLKELAMMLKEA